MRKSRIYSSFFKTNHPVKQRNCDFPGCCEAGLFRAPKSREALRDYYWFCIEHVREYNENWDFLKGLSPEEIEEIIRNDTVWERPSWPLGEAVRIEKKIREKIAREFFGSEEVEEENKTSIFANGEAEALITLGLKPPVKFATIKARYRSLVKQFHPDTNNGSRFAEEKLKTINQAFTTLKMIYLNRNEKN